MKRSAIFTVIAVLALNPLLSAKESESPKPMSERQIERMHQRNKREAQEAWARDRKEFEREEFAALEADYQNINENYRAPEIGEIIERFLKKYKAGNRVGCATLYLAQKSRGKEKEELLLKAINDFSDSYYLNGCNVGGLARLQLARYYQESGEESKAKKLVEEIQKDFKTAQDQRGKPILEQLEGLGE